MDRREKMPEDNRTTKNLKQRLPFSTTVPREKKDVKKTFSEQKTWSIASTHATNLNMGGETHPIPYPTTPIPRYSLPPPSPTTNARDHATISLRFIALEYVPLSKKIGARMYAAEPSRQASYA